MKLKETYSINAPDKRIIKREFEFTFLELEEIIKTHCQNIMLKMNPETGVLNPKIEIRYQLIDCGNAGMVLDQYFEYKE